MEVHPTHETRYSDASSFDEVCKKCGATDRRGSDLLEQPCPNAGGKPHEGPFMVIRSGGVPWPGGDSAPSAQADKTPIQAPPAAVLIQAVPAAAPKSGGRFSLLEVD